MEHEKLKEYEKPEYSKKRVYAAGKKIRADAGTDEDKAVLENWRASHAYILHKFHSIVRDQIQDTYTGERLKRRPTIINKLQRQYEQKGEDMNLARMHDIAGCRVIFTSEKKLLEFRHSPCISNAEYELRGGQGCDRYNYIEKPKPSGYRGIHDIYVYRPSTEKEKPWDGLSVEIQYRTRVQHAWATAVETVDVMKLEHTKFGEADADTEKFFQLASEILARAHEKRNSCFPKMSDSEILADFSSVDEKLGIMKTFSNLSPRPGKEFGEYTILKLVSSGQNKRGNLQTEGFDNQADALKRYSELESEISKSADVVLIRSDDKTNARETFRNYFSNTTSFVGYINKGIEILRK